MVPGSPDGVSGMDGSAVKLLSRIYRWHVWIIRFSTHFSENVRKERLKSLFTYRNYLSFRYMAYFFVQNLLDERTGINHQTVIYRPESVPTQLSDTPREVLKNHQNRAI